MYRFILFWFLFLCKNLRDDLFELFGDFVMVVMDWKLDVFIEIKSEVDWGFNLYVLVFLWWYLFYKIIKFYGVLCLIFRFLYGFNEIKCYLIMLDVMGGVVGFFLFEFVFINGRGIIKKRY